MKFHKTLLAFKTPKCGVFIAKCQNTKKKCLKYPKRAISNAYILAFHMSKLALNFYEMDPWTLKLRSNK